MPFLAAARHTPLALRRQLEPFAPRMPLEALARHMRRALRTPLQRLALRMPLIALMNGPELRRA